MHNLAPDPIFFIFDGDMLWCHAFCVGGAFTNCFTFDTAAAVCANGCAYGQV